MIFWPSMMLMFRTIKIFFFRVPYSIYFRVKKGLNSTKHQHQHIDLPLIEGGGR
jgi:hypothetical protein